MATEKLTRAVISGPLTAMDDAIRPLMHDREFQPLQASTTLGGRGELQVPDTDDVYRPVLDSAVALLGKLGVKPAFREFSGAGYTLENCQKAIADYTGEVARLATKRNSALSLAHDDEELIGRLEPFSLLEVDLEELLDMKSMRLHFGSTEMEYWPELRREAEEERRREEAVRAEVKQIMAMLLNDSDPKQLTRELLELSAKIDAINIKDFFNSKTGAALRGKFRSGLIVLKTIDPHNPMIREMEAMQGKWRMKAAFPFILMGVAVVLMLILEKLGIID